MLVLPPGLFRVTLALRSGVGRLDLGVGRGLLLPLALELPATEVASCKGRGTMVLNAGVGRVFGVVGVGN